MTIFRKLLIESAVMTGAALFMAFLGPFGTFAVSFGERLLAWAIVAFGGYVFFRPVIAGGRALAAQTGLPDWAMIAIACLFASLPTTLLVAWVFTGLDFGNLTVVILADFYPRVLLVGAAVTVVQWLAGRTSLSDALQSEADAEAEVEAETEAEIVPIRPLAAGLGGDVLYLENEDHYVRVHRREGSELILMRMRDAADALHGVEGARVHRSWWVARTAVVDVRKRDRTVMLTLIDGREIPVSRAMMSPLRKAGWF